MAQGREGILYHGRRQLRSGLDRVSKENGLAHCLLRRPAGAACKSIPFFTNYLGLDMYDANVDCQVLVININDKTGPWSVLKSSAEGVSLRSWQRF